MLTKFIGKAVCYPRSLDFLQQVAQHLTSRIQAAKMIRNSVLVQRRASFYVEGWLSEPCRCSFTTGSGLQEGCGRSTVELLTNAAAL
jgi:hypothetical protein